MYDSRFFRGGRGREGTPLDLGDISGGRAPLTYFFGDHSTPLFHSNYQKNKPPPFKGGGNPQIIQNFLTRANSIKESEIFVNQNKIVVRVLGVMKIVF